jgi:hypothetical protein
MLSPEQREDAPDLARCYDLLQEATFPYCSQRQQRRIAIIYLFPKRSDPRNGYLLWEINPKGEVTNFNPDAEIISFRHQEAPMRSCGEIIRKSGTVALIPATSEAREKIDRSQEKGTLKTACFKEEGMFKEMPF